MASDNEASCINDPNFAAICSFLEKFGASCGIISPDFLELQEMLENTQEVSPELIDLHIKLLRKVKRSVSADRWERVLIKLCHTYCSQDAWELERFGYKKARLTSKLRILKILLEIQFDLNPKFKAEVNRLTANELRTQPIGRDKHGHSYWYQIDEHCQLRIYREDPDEETWLLVAKDREGLVRLISQLASNDPNLGDLTLNEDSNSLEIEKPIIDTGQTSSSTSNCEPEADESSEGNDDSKPLTNENTTETDEKPEIQDSKIKITLSAGKILTQSNQKIKEQIQEANTKKCSKTLTEAAESSLQYETKGVDLSNKRKKSINELAANLRIKTHEQLYKNPVQEQEMDLSVKKPRFSSLSEPPFEPMSLETALRMTSNFPESEEELTDEEDELYDSDEIELPSHMKQPRLDRPKLLNNTKKKTYSDEEDEDDYGEEIEEPVMIIHGEGSGRDCENENIYKCEFSEVVEEPVMFIYGEGFGYDCETGNTGKEEENTTPPKRSDSVSANDSDSAEIKYDSCESTSKQSEFVSKCVKIGKVIVDVKSADRIPSTDIVSAKKNSRWDIGKPISKSESVNSSIKNESNNKTNIDTTCDKTNLPTVCTKKQPMFFFGPGCFQFKTPITPYTPDVKGLNTKSANDHDDNKNVHLNLENVPVCVPKINDLLVNENLSSTSKTQPSENVVIHKENMLQNEKIVDTSKDTNTEMKSKTSMEVPSDENQKMLPSSVKCNHEGNKIFSEKEIVSQIDTNIKCDDVSIGESTCEQENPSNKEDSTNKNLNVTIMNIEEKLEVVQDTALESSVVDVIKDCDDIQEKSSIMDETKILESSNISKTEIKSQEDKTFTSKQVPNIDNESKASIESKTKAEITSVNKSEQITNSSVEEANNGEQQRETIIEKCVVQEENVSNEVKETEAKSAEEAVVDECEKKMSLELKLVDTSMKEKCVVSEKKEHKETKTVKEEISTVKNKHPSIKFEDSAVHCIKKSKNFTVSTILQSTEHSSTDETNIVKSEIDLANKSNSSKVEEIQTDNRKCVDSEILLIENKESEINSSLGSFIKTHSDKEALNTDEKKILDLNPTENNLEICDNTIKDKKQNLEEIAKKLLPNTEENAEKNISKNERNSSEIIVGNTYCQSMKKLEQSIEDKEINITTESTVTVKQQEYSDAKKKVENTSCESMKKLEQSIEDKEINITNESTVTVKQQECSDATKEVEDTCCDMKKLEQSIEDKEINITNKSVTEKQECSDAKNEDESCESMKKLEESIEDKGITVTIESAVTEKQQECSVATKEVENTCRESMKKLELSIDDKGINITTESAVTEKQDCSDATNEDKSCESMKKLEESIEDKRITVTTESAVTEKQQECSDATKKVEDTCCENMKKIEQSIGDKEITDTTESAVTEKEQECSDATKIVENTGCENMKKLEQSIEDKRINVTTESAVTEKQQECSDAPKEVENIKKLEQSIEDKRINVTTKSAVTEKHQECLDAPKEVKNMKKLKQSIEDKRINVTTESAVPEKQQECSDAPKEVENMKKLEQSIEDKRINVTTKSAVTEKQQECSDAPKEVENIKKLKQSIEDKRINVTTKSAVTEKHQECLDAPKEVKNMKKLKQSIEDKRINVTTESAVPEKQQECSDAPKEVENMKKLEQSIEDKRINVTTESAVTEKQQECSDAPKGIENTYCESMKKIEQSIEDKGINVTTESIVTEKEQECLDATKEVENTSCESIKKLEQSIEDNEINITAKSSVTEKQEECSDAKKDEVKLNESSYQIENEIIQEEPQTKILLNDSSDEIKHIKEDDNKILVISAEDDELIKPSHIVENKNKLFKEKNEINHITEVQQNSNSLEKNQSDLSIKEKDKTIHKDYNLECEPKTVDTGKKIQNITVININTQCHSDLSITEIVKKIKDNKIKENLKSDTIKELTSVTSESEDIDKNINTSLQESECNDSFSSDGDMMDSCAFEDDDDDDDDEYNNKETIQDVKPDKLQKTKYPLKDAASTKKIIFKNVQEIIADKNKTKQLTLDDNKTDVVTAKITASNIESSSKLNIKDKKEEKKSPVLICVDITKLQDKLSSKPENKLVTELKQQSNISSPRSLESIGVDNEESNDVIDVPETDPLACTEEEEILISTKMEKESVKSQRLSLTTFKLDGTDETDTSSLIPEPIARALRSRKISVKETNISARKNMSARKKGKNDVKIVAGIRNKKRKPKRDVSSSEEDKNESPPDPPCPIPQRGTGKAKRGRMRGRGRGAHISRVTNESPVLSSDPQSETTNSPVANKTSRSRKKRRVLGLDIDPSAIIQVEGKTEDEESSRRGSIRQSRRIAQLKIREEAERRKIEELTLIEIKEQKKKKAKKDDDKDYKVENKKKKHKESENEEESEEEVIEISSKRKHKKKHKHQDLKKLFNVTNPWQSSSGSSTSNEEEEEEEVEEEPSDDEAVFKSDHEFSPESDLESNAEVQPLRRARTVKKESDTEEPTDEHACQKCSKADHPEWILLCDKCDCGWHCSCLRPALLVIPEGDWFCPPCQHISLIEALKVQLVEYDKRMNRREMEVRRKQRLAYVGISLDNVLPSKEHEGKEEENKIITQKMDSDDESSDSDSNSESDSSSGDESEPIYQLRERRQAHSYRFNDYDELINSAIQDELEAVKGAGNQGRGKDIATIVNAEKEEAKTQALLDQQTHLQEPKEEFEKTPPVVPVYETKVEQEVEASEEYSDEEPRVKRKLKGRRKHRKLNSLDISSEDDPDDDEDFKGTSASEEEDLDDIGSEDSEELEMGKKGRGRYGPTRRSTRTRTMRYDKDFINDDSEDDTPRRKKSKSIWDESESEQSDKSWGKKKRDKKRQSLIPRSTKISRKRKRRDDDDPEIKSRIKKPKIKYGGLNDSEDEELLTRRTRGKKINYIDALGSDTDEDKRKTKPLESEDEYVVNEEDEDQDEAMGAMDRGEKYSDSDSGQNKAAPVIMKKVIKIIAPSKTKGRGKAGIPRPQNLKPVSPEFSATTETEPKDESFEDVEDEDYPSIPADIPVIAANPEDLNEEEVGTMMMENEEYAKKQLELMAIQLAKEKKKKEKEAKKLTDVPAEPKKRGRKKKSEIEAALAASKESVNPVLVELEPSNKLVPSSPDAPNLDLPATVPTVVSELATTPPKRRGRGKGKKTLAAQAAAVTPTGPIITTSASQESVIVPTTQVPDINKSVPATPFQNEPNPPQNLNIVGGKLGIAPPPQPFSQNQPTPSVITRMLQSQPMSAQTFTTAANSINQKYFPPGSPSGQFPSVGGRGRVPSPYRQSPPAMTMYPGVRPVAPNSPHRLRSPGPPNMQMFHSTHHSLDPSPSGGGPINIVSTNRDRNSPATVSSPLPSKEVLTTPPPPPYSRATMAVSRFSPNENSPGPSLPPPIRHHIFAQSSPPPRPPPAGNFSPYHPPPPPNYHYGAYPPAPSLAAADDALPPTDYQGSPYSEHYNPMDGTVHSSEGSNSKPFDEEGSGEFGGLVSYFSSQREDDLDT